MAKSNSEEPQERLSLELLGRPYNELSPTQKSVIDLIASEKPHDLHPHLKLDDRSLGQRLADRVAQVGGSWGFIIAFMVVLSVWMLWNIATKAVGLAFDPFPFIFLNLMLSMLAAIQAPIIMMSQNRAAQKDREAAEHNHIVNLRSALEIMRLHKKLNALKREGNKSK